MDDASVDDYMPCASSCHDGVVRVRSSCSDTRRVEVIQLHDPLLHLQCGNICEDAHEDAPVRWSHGSCIDIGKH